MRIADVLRNKGSDVATMRPEATVRELLAGLAGHNIGAMVVVGSAGVIAGIVSERDIVRKLYEHGPDVLELPVAQIMTPAVATCGMDSSVDDLSEMMTHNRVRHIPVLVEGRLAGIVSIGDIVKTRLEELKSEQEQLQAYITQG
ncbi:CBS domain-containing protein [Mycolicibacterium confluentis]|uniref:Signal transduction protein n=1 Tax=Mycolicibacterium confluentis TaxID=28047 RepID=A0A7I7XUH0_9MYCO|nr:CBS domain-containing protein [Mycolicibacterium confluentis]MCV7320779.1 CBS domain-containing protein [Mycolicibacterium confluentis]ORV27164.1 histidine kinase [Mycolicibacterium confluentis]BBZ32821.1 signal transduction protein [Mycolicibacterium confluentis]